MYITRYNYDVVNHAETDIHRMSDRRGMTRQQTITVDLHEVKHRGETAPAGESIGCNPNGTVIRNVQEDTSRRTSRDHSCS